MPPNPRAIRDSRQFEQAEEFEVWERFREGNEVAFSYIYDSYYDVLCRKALQFSPNKSLIKDCIQDLFITIHKNRKNLGTTNSIQAYLSLSVKRKLARYLKKENRYETLDERQEEDFEEEDDEPKTRQFCKNHRVDKSKGNVTENVANYTIKLDSIKRNS